MTFGGTCTPTTCTTSIITTSNGVVTWGGKLGTFTIASITGASKPAIGPNPDMDVNIQNLVASAGGTLTVDWTDVGFTMPDAASVAMAAGGLITNSTISFTAYFDNTNTPFGTGATAGTLGPFSAGSSQTPYSGNFSGTTVPNSAQYSMTEEIKVTMNTSGKAGGDFEFQMLPSPLTLTCPPSSGQVGVPYTGSLHATGGVPAYIFSVISGALPDGLTLDANSGAITGTPTTATTFTFTGEVQDQEGVTADTPAPYCTITIQPKTQLYIIAGYTYSDIGSNPPDMMYDAGDIPIPGVTITLYNGNTCTGTPLGTMVTDVNGHYEFDNLPAGTYSVCAPPTANGETHDTSSILTPTVGPDSLNNNFGYLPPLAISCSASTGQVNVPYNSAFTATGGVTPYTFSLKSGTLPPGLTLNADGTITGTPTTPGPFNFVVQVTDNIGTVADNGPTGCGITINPPPSASCVAINAVQNVAITPVTLVGTGGDGGPYTFSATGLPTGLSISSSGTISGTPTVTGTFNYTVTITDKDGHSGTINCSVTVNPPPTASCVIITAVQGVAITPVTMIGSGGVGGPYTFSATGLPNGLTMSSGGTISGTPTVSGTFNYTVTVTDSAGNQGTVNCSVTVNPPPTAGCVSITAVQGVAITPVTMVGSGGVGGPYTFSATGLPNGLTMSSGGTISGTPTVNGTFNYTVTVTDSAGNQGTVNCSVTVNPPQGKTFSIGPSSMEGALKILPGDWVSGGFSFTYPGSHPAVTETIISATVSVPVSCVQGGPAVGTITVPIGSCTFNGVCTASSLSYNIPTNNNAWWPTGDANNVASWQGAARAPDFCGGSTMYNSIGAIFTATVTKSPAITQKANFRFKYRDPNAKGKGNVNCTDQTNPKRSDAATCGASWSGTVTDP